jgi:hypothetical protein
MNVSVHEREKEKKSEKKKKGKNFETCSKILVSLVKRNVTTQAPFGNSNTSNNNINNNSRNNTNNNINNKNSRTQMQKKFAAFNIKQQIIEFF